MSTMKVFCLLLCLCLFQLIAQAQESLEPVNDTASLIGDILGGDKGVTDVRLISDTEEGATVEVDFKGFEGKYTVKGLILNKLKKPIAEISCEPQTLAKPNGTAELRFQFKAGSGSYSNSMLETHFLSVVFSKSDGLLSGLDLGSGDVLAETYLYKMNKMWRVGGSESMIITVKLTPFKSAASIKP